MKRTNIIIISLIAIFVIVGTIITTSSYSVINTINTQEVEVLGYECENTNDCFNSLIADGFPEADLIEELTQSDLHCNANVCEVRR